jgi:trimeric autotransporter adhesin
MMGKYSAMCVLAITFTLIGMGCSKDDANPVTDDKTESTSDTKDDDDDDTGSSNKGVSHEDDSDYLWDASSEVLIELNGSSISTNSTDVVVDGSLATINAAGNYKVVGNLSNGQIVINSSDKGVVRLILSGVDITSSTSSPLFIRDAGKVVIALANNTQNKLTDASTYVYASADITEPSAALYSKVDLTIFGNGSLSVTGNYNDGISSKDGLIVKSGSISVNAVDDGIRGKDYLIFKGGTTIVNSGGNGLKSDNETVSTAGYVTIDDGTITVVAKGDGLQAKTDVSVNGGTLTITSGDASNNTSVAKGIKAGGKFTQTYGASNITVLGNVLLTAKSSGYDPSYCVGLKSESGIGISGGAVTIVNNTAGGKGLSSDTDINIANSTVKITANGKGATYKNTSGATDSYSAACVKANGNITITNGSLSTTSSGAGGKGLVANGVISIGDVSNSPILNITTSGAKFLVSGSDYNHPKAIKSDGELVINNGEISISSTDDGLCSASSITINNGKVGINNSVEGIESKYITINGGEVSVAASDDGINATMGTVTGGTESNDGSCFTMNGGSLMVSTTKGDALDSNGNIVMTGGTVIVHGPPSSPEEAVDFNGTFKTTGGFFIASGIKSNMNKPMSTSSTQLNVFASTSSSVSANTIFRIQDALGNDLVTFKPARAAGSFIFSSPLLARNTTYYIYVGGSCTGTLQNGLYNGGTYTAGTQRTSFTLSSSSSVTSVSF